MNNPGSWGESPPYSWVHSSLSWLSGTESDCADHRQSDRSATLSPRILAPSLLDRITVVANRPDLTGSQSGEPVRSCSGRVSRKQVKNKLRVVGCIHRDAAYLSFGRRAHVRWCRCPRDPDLCRPAVTREQRLRPGSLAGAGGARRVAAGGLCGGCGRPARRGGAGRGWLHSGWRLLAGWGGASSSVRDLPAGGVAPVPIKEKWGGPQSAPSKGSHCQRGGGNVAPQEEGHVEEVFGAVRFVERWDEPDEEGMPMQR
jgi:hypothetical protein